ncbi:protein FAM163B [Acipenser oxyrinchus oxyrinchus]|uniref:Protein FAM163B n=1 Tax=Acipenser oxyrinchus oxyrinchus TaxID=40147 RepID=A0AAD8CUF9_ACIOX|nr:protein FAM163B-like [Acipenser ruthenus]XP_058861333.1 protein FAM163B-like [Acipenser ruthenus]XP_058861334.1 protein FAM163B-like [Acipenser ruthenus]XP_058861335.1 protein FAM163B-like [Acipenser ruthenus]KAK1155638.1 protein FAM163B [Acipenser oxyrinchus oxyrinchus]KAK1155748.1 protein FAM163B [Acipenser oxyrinchus oxyrinchus]
MTAGTVVITGGILATVILLCIIAVLCYCRLQYYCCKKKEESEEDEEEPDFAMHSHLPPVHCNHNVVAAANGPAIFTPPLARKLTRSQTYCPNCTHSELPFYLQHPEELRNGGDRVSYRTVQQEDLDLPMDLASFRKLNLTRSVTMKEVFTHSRSISTDV